MICDIQIVILCNLHSKICTQLFSNSCHDKQLFYFLSDFISEFVHNRKLSVEMGQSGLQQHLCYILTLLHIQFSYLDTTYWLFLDVTNGAFVL